MFALLNGNFQFVGGGVVANGSLVMQLSAPAIIISTGAAAPSSYTFNLDANGNLPAGSNVWGNGELSVGGIPGTTNYTLTVYAGPNATGGIAYGPYTQFVGPFAPYAGFLFPDVVVVPLISVSTVDGVLITGVPSAGQTIMATGAAAAAWQWPVTATASQAHKFVTAIDHSGAGTLVQPAFTDISGVAAAAQLPTPTASTLGGIESFAAVTHQWINAISTAGVPSATQPAFSDISGTATAAQLPVTAALKPASSDHIQFVSPNGNDANDGLSWGSAKLTAAAAISAIGSNTGRVIESPALGADGIAATGSATGLNGMILAPGKFYIGPSAQATAGPVNQNSLELRLAGSLWNGSQAVDDFYTLKVFENSTALTTGSDLELNHSSISGGAGRFLINTDTVIGTPASADAGHNYNSFAGDIQGNYWDGSAAQANLWEWATTTTPTSGFPINSRLTFIPIFTGSSAGCTADFCIGGTGTLGAQGNYAGPPMWRFIVLPTDAFTASFAHTLTASRTVTIVDADSNTVRPSSAAAHQFATGIAATGIISYAQPAFSDLSGSIALAQTVLTTLGDVLYVAAGPALARLAGNTTSTKQFLSQTGTGSVSAAPAWVQPAAADLSNGVTGSGAVVLAVSPALTTSASVTGVQPGSVSGSGTAATAVLSVTGGKGGNTSGTTGQTAGAGGAISITGGAGGDAPGGSTNGAGGAATVNGGAAGAGAGSAGAIGAVVLQSTGGFVGINTAAPSVPLHVRTTGSGGAFQVLIDNGAAGGSTWYLGSSDNGNGVGGGFFLINNGTSSSTAALRIDSSKNIYFQGKLSTYQGVALAGNGIPTEPATPIDLTTQGAAIGATLLYAVPAAGGGLYRISWCAKVTRAATTSSVLGGTNGFQVTYTDNDDSVTVTPTADPTASGTGNSTSTQVNGVVVVNAKGGTNLQYRFDYTSVGGTTMQYALHIRAEQM